MASDQKMLTNWGRYPRVLSEVDSPVFASDVNDAVSRQTHLLARGNGRCYGDAALSEQVLSTLKLNRMLDFDPARMEIEVESGILLADLVDFLVPRGFFLPVTPGTKFITVGGAIAADVHGKNHHRDGCFSNYLLHFDLVTAEGQTVRCSREDHPDLFWQSVGGMGLTGVITRARFQLRQIETAYVRQESIKAPNLGAVMDLFEESEGWTYTMAWLDCLRHGKSMGRSILIRGEHAQMDELPPSLRKNPLGKGFRSRLNIPFEFPDFVLNRISMRVFNFFYYHKQWQHRQTGLVGYDSFFYPLDALQNWNRIYGPGGFTQYQFVLPKAHSRKGLEEVLAAIGNSREGAFLTVLKLFGPANPLAINSFPMEGYTLALDFKITRGLPALIATLDKVVARYGGRIYLAKDAFSTIHGLPENATFSRKGKFRSLQQERIFGSVRSGNPV